MSKLRVIYWMVMLFFLPHPVYSEKADPPSVVKYFPLEKRHHTQYLLFIPGGYRISGNDSWPLIFGLHYSSGSAQEYLPYWQEEAEKRGYFILCPDARDRNRWSEKEARVLIKLLKSVLKSYRIDPKRVLLTGNSAGGIYAYYLGINHYEFFSAVAPIVGSLVRIQDAVDFGRCRAKPRFCIVHAAKDKIVPLHEAYQSYTRLNQHGFDTSFYVFQDDDHYNIYRTKEILDWFENKSPLGRLYNVRFSN
ncbi:MAG: prolyl oligopeptidase family serine peptidase [Candidatus Aureabacteria bacterium]|nr:prolyl oligopeptidase family serine peptidase [Candidatus Auribacterota bacterium]